MVKDVKEPLLNAEGAKKEKAEEEKTLIETLKEPKTIGIAVLVLVLAGLGYANKDMVKKYVGHLWNGLKGLGYGACPIVIFLCWLLTTVSGPAFIIEVAAGALFQSMFGMSKGAPIAMVCCGLGIWSGCITAFFLGRKYFKPSVQVIIDKHEVLKTVNEIISEEGWKFAFLMRLNPLIPFELFNYAVAMTDITPGHNAIAAIGTMPIVFFEVYSAASAAEIASAAGSTSGEGSGDKIKDTLIKLAISGVLIAVVCAYGKIKYDAKVASMAASSEAASGASSKAPTGSIGELAYGGSPRKDMRKALTGSFK